MCQLFDSFDKMLVRLFLLVQFFDDVKIEDPRVPELCLKAGQPTPFAVLHECLKR
jgi:hypothetical protein